MAAKEVAAEAVAAEVVATLVGRNSSTGRMAVTLVLLLFSGEASELPSTLSLACPLAALLCEDETGDNDDDPASSERGEPRGVGRCPGLSVKPVLPCPPSPLEALDGMDAIEPQEAARGWSASS